MKPAVPTMKEVDHDRARYAALKKEREECPKGGCDGCHARALEMAEVAVRVGAALAARNACKPCPWCSNGVLAPTPTQGRLECVDCRGLALRTAGDAKVHTGGVA